MRQCRLRAAELFGHGATQAEVARALQVSRQAASVWHARLKAGGTTALAGAGRQGRRPQLSVEQRAVIDQALRQGARAHGFASDGWSLERVALIRPLTAEPPAPSRLALRADLRRCLRTGRAMRRPHGKRLH